MEIKTQQTMKTLTLEEIENKIGRIENRIAECSIASDELLKTQELHLKNLGKLNSSYDQLNEKINRIGIKNNES